MANQLYGYTARYSSSSPSTSLSATLQRYLDAELQHPQPWPPGVEVPSSAATAAVPSTKRPTEVLYLQNVLDAHNTIGQTEAWYSTLLKRPRLETSHLPVYPQRPGEKDCAHYMLTRTCKFGDSCRFDHPIWVPEGGIPDWKEVPLDATGDLLPERVGAPDCPYFLKTQRCKFGSKCKFNHPKDKLATSESGLPERPSEPPCAFYLKTGKCKFGATCKFDHPKDYQPPLSGQDNSNQIETGGAVGDVKPAIFHNTKGLPIRLEEADCPFYLKTGSCKYGSSCRYNHPDRNAFTPPAAVIGHSLLAAASNLNMGVVTSAASLYQPTLLGQLGVVPTVYPQRPGQADCDYYMKTGHCKFGETCKYHHPIDRSVSTTKQTSQEVKLTLAGFPRREGGAHCPYYMRTGTCKYGSTCKFDHPPPGEVLTFAGTSTSDENGDKKEG